MEPNLPALQRVHFGPNSIAISICGCKPAATALISDRTSRICFGDLSSDLASIQFGHSFAQSRHQGKRFRYRANINFKVLVCLRWKFAPLRVGDPDYAKRLAKRSNCKN
jgi:hypothetical protein